jgi:hypothetical protein
MNLSHTSWSNPLLFIQSTTSWTLHSITRVLLYPVSNFCTGLSGKDGIGTGIWKSVSHHDEFIITKY